MSRFDSDQDGPFVPAGGGTMTGPLDMTGEDITDVGGLDAATVRSGRAVFASSTSTAALGAADVYACTDTTSARTLTISTSTIAEGTATRPREINVTDSSGGAGTNNITIVTEGGQTIDGAATASIVVDFGTVNLLADGSALVSTSGSGRTNAADRVPLTADPITTVDVFSAADLPAAVTAPDGVTRVPLALNTEYVVHKEFVWPRLLLPIGTVDNLQFTFITTKQPNSTLLFAGDSTPHIYGREIGAFWMAGVTAVDISNGGSGRGTVLMDITGGSKDATVAFDRCLLSAFAKVGSLSDVGLALFSPTPFADVGGGLALLLTGVYEQISVQAVSIVASQRRGLPVCKPMLAVLGQASEIPVSIALGGANMNAGDPAFYIDPLFGGTVSISNVGYGGTTSGDFFRADVSLGITAEASADQAITALGPDTRSVLSVVAGPADAVFVVGARHNWRVGEAVTHAGFGEASYNGSKTVASISVESYTVATTPFVATDTGTATHDARTLVSAAGHQLYVGSVVLLGGATPGAYTGLHEIQAVENDQDGFTIPVTYSVGGTGTIQATRVTTSADHPMVRGEQTTISGTAAYDGTRPILKTPADDQFDISVAFVTDEGAVGTVASSGLTETALQVNSRGNGAQKDSAAIGSVVVVGNATATDMSGGPNDWTDLDLGGLAAAGTNIERWGSIDSTTGEMTYLGTPDFSGEAGGYVSATSAGGSQRFQFRFVVNGAPQSGGEVVSVDLSSSPMLAIPLVAPIQCVTGDTVRLQVQNTSGTSDVLIQDMSVAIE